MLVDATHNIPFVCEWVEQSKLVAFPYVISCVCVCEGVE